MKIKTEARSVEKTPQVVREMKKILLHLGYHPSAERLKLHRKKKGHSDTAMAKAV